MTSEQANDAETVETAHRTRQPNKTLDWEGITAEQLLELRKYRGAAKGNVTKKRHEFMELLLVQDGIDSHSAKTKLLELEHVMENFKICHDSYHNRLRDEIEIEESEEYFRAEERKFTDIKQRVSNVVSHLESRPSAPDINPEDSVSIASRKSYSKAGSRGTTSSAASFKMRAVARKAILEAEAAKLEKYNILQQQELHLKQVRKGLEFETEIAKAEAEERVYALAEIESQLPYALNPKEIMSESQPQTQLMSQPQTQLMSQPQLSSTSQYTSQPQTQLMSQPQLSSMPQYTSQSQTQFMSQPRMSSMSQPQTQYALHPQSQPGTELSTQPKMPAYLARKSLEPGTGSTYRSITGSTERASLDTEYQLIDNRTRNVQSTQNKISLIPLTSEWARDEQQSQVYSVADSTIHHGFSPTQQMIDIQSEQRLQLEQLLIQQQQHSLALTLPQPEVPTFKGDPTEYSTFVRAFETLIERKITSPSARLYYLVQYTHRDVQELVRSCLTMNEEEGYLEARRLLKDKYGQAYRIACAFVDRLTKGSTIKSEDGAGLHKFSILLTSCTNTLREIGFLSKVENPDSLKKIIERLPFGLKRKWRDIAVRITENERREITIKDIAEFVSARARAATHPIFGDLGTDTKVNNSSKPKGAFPRNNASIFATQGTGVSKPRTNDYAGNVVHQQTTWKTNKVCPLCTSDHWLSQCDSFKKKKIGERRSFVRSKNICDNCLVPGHYARSCSKASFCKVPDCTGKGKHSTYLHPDANEQNDAAKLAASHFKEVAMD